ncbi:MAG: pentapeptide repeat-containing protein, partial [Ktedonobacteraceae bacterium]|nr:pentapeptide repeat-containing protein [Ktedonobacteraceae bacterium]
SNSLRLHRFETRGAVTRGLRNLRFALILLVLFAVTLGMLWSFGILSDMVRWWFATGALILLAFTIYRERHRLTWPAWTGLSEDIPTADGKGSSQRGKTLWDWMQVMGVPLALLIAVTMITNGQRAAHVQFASNRQAETILINTENTLSDLLLHAKLVQSRPGDEVRLVAHAHVLNALRQLDPERKRYLIDFLYNANLISGHQPIVSLHDADISQVNLSHLNLFQVNLSGADLSDANFISADLERANLTGAHLSRVDATAANLEGADLGGASLDNIVLDHADLLHATNVQSALHNARSLSGAKLPDGKMAP